MANYFSDNPDLLFHYNQLNLEETVDLLEQGYSNASRFEYAPVDYADAMENYRRILELTGVGKLESVEGDVVVAEVEHKVFKEIQIVDAVPRNDISSRAESAVTSRTTTM